MDTMPLRRLASSKNSQANDDVPSPLEGLPPMNAKRLYKYLGTWLVWLSFRLELLRLMFRDNRHLLRAITLMTLRSWVLFIFSSTSNLIEVESWILKIENFFLCHRLL